MKQALCAIVVVVMKAALGYGSEADFWVRVTDDDGTPVSNATVGATYERGGWSASPPAFGSIGAVTDTNGICELRGNCNGELVWGVKKEGYYATRNLELAFAGVLLGHLQPWGAHQAGTWHCGLAGTTAG